MARRLSHLVAKPDQPRDKTAPEVAVKTPDKTPLSPLPPMKEPEPTPVVETSPTMELFKPSAVNPPQLLLLSVHELDQEKRSKDVDLEDLGERLGRIGVEGRHRAGTDPKWRSARRDAAYFADPAQTLGRAGARIVDVLASAG